jgi:hypothetical protein
MWILAWTLNEGNNVLPDFWTVHETELDARKEYQRILHIDNLHCACIAPIADATEPHWVNP